MEAMLWLIKHVYFILNHPVQSVEKYSEHFQETDLVFLSRSE